MERWVHTSYQRTSEGKIVHGSASGPFYSHEDASIFAAEQKDRVCVRITMWNKVPEDWVSQEDNRNYAVLRSHHKVEPTIFQLQFIPYTAGMSKKALLEQYAEQCGTTVEEYFGDPHGDDAGPFLAWIVSGATKKCVEACSFESGSDTVAAAITRNQYEMIEATKKDTKHFT